MKQKTQIGSNLKFQKILFLFKYLNNLFKISESKREELFDKNVRSGPKVWDHWGKWSQCTVTCGIGKITRWRHCISGGCARGEKEAQIKTCTMPAC